MRILIQRVRESGVTSEGTTLGEIGPGLLLFIGIGREDEGPGMSDILHAMAGKVANLRIFADEAGKMNRSILETGGEILAVSQFTLHADCRKGRRPHFMEAAPPEAGEQGYNAFVGMLQNLGIRTEQGRFGAMMEVHLVNDGPVTIWLDSIELGLHKAARPHSE